MPAPFDTGSSVPSGDGVEPLDLPVLPLGTDPPPRHQRRAWLAVALCALPVAVLVMALLPGDPPGDPEDPTQTAIAELAPAAAWDGKESMMLPVTAVPSTGLVDGQRISVRGEGFPPGVDVGIVMCTSQAAFGGGAAWCDIMRFDSVTTDAQGTFVAPYQVRRFLEAGGTRWDCTAGNVDPAGWLEQRAAGTLGPDPSAWSCIVAAGMLTDYDVSGGMPLAFAPDGEPEDPMALDPSSCTQVHTAAGVVPTCPHLSGGPRLDCADDEVAVVTQEGVTACEPAPPPMTVIGEPSPSVGSAVTAGSATSAVTALPGPSSTVVSTTTTGPP